MTTPVKSFTAEERQGWIDFCVGEADDLGIEHNGFADLTDEQLDKEADWYYEMQGK
jgi:hypothetical protein